MFAFRFFLPWKFRPSSFQFPWRKQWERERKSEKNWNKTFKGKDFSFKDFCIIRKGTYSPTEKGWCTLKTFVDYLYLLVGE